MTASVIHQRKHLQSFSENSAPVTSSVRTVGSCESFVAEMLAHVGSSRQVDALVGAVACCSCAMERAWLRLAQLVTQQRNSSHAKLASRKTEELASLTVGLQQSWELDRQRACVQVSHDISF